MSRTLILYIVLIIITAGLIIAIDASRPRPVDWRPTYAVKDKIPLGLYVLDHEMKALLKADTLERMKLTPYEFLDGKYDAENSRYRIKGSFVHIGESETIDRESAQELLYFAEHGNTVFLSMSEFPKTLTDSLKLETEDVFYLRDSMRLALPYSKTLAGKKYFYKEGVGLAGFTEVDTANTAILGYQHVDKDSTANFIKVRHGKGSFLLHLQPAAFSNFHLLKGDHADYAAGVLSYLPKGNVYLFSERYKNSISGSPLRYIWSQPALAAAAWLSIIGVFVFMFFNAKRKQRIIPEIPPVKNTTVDFTRTIGNLYYQEGSHHAIITKMIVYFLEKVRNVYMIDTFALDNDFTEKLHQKTNRPKEDIEDVVKLIRQHRNRFDSTQTDVTNINKAIEKLEI